MDDSAIVTDNDIILQLPITPTTKSKKISIDSGVSSSRTPEDGCKNLFEEDTVDGFFPTSNSREADVLKQYYSKLILAMDSEIMSLSASLFSNNMISQETKYKVLDCSETPSRNKCAIVLKDLETHILLEPQFLLDLLGFFDLEGSEVLKQVSRDMRTKLDELPPKPPTHSISEINPRPTRKSYMCLRPFASSPAAFSPALDPFCEHCEFQYRALKAVLDKFWYESLKESLTTSENEIEPLPKESNGYCPEVAVLTDQEFSNSDSLKESLDSELQKASLPSDSGSGPRSLELKASLFESVRSLDRQNSYDSVGSDDYIAKLTSEFFEKLKKFHHNQKQSRKRIANEKKIISEKLKLTADEIKKLINESTKNEEELREAKTEIAILKNSLEDANSRQMALVKEVLQYKRQLQTEKCTNGNSVDCKHFVKCSSLEQENAALKKEVERSEGYSAEYKAKIEALELQISVLLDRF